nr:uncharacterized protein LOC116774155 [Danaus plexippus plexippus]
MKLLLLIFLVPLTICSANIPISPDLLETVFGHPDNATNDLKPAVSQALPVAPGSVNPAYHPTYPKPIEQYYPALAEYDKFDWTLTKRVASSSQENFLLSPMGVKLAMAILMEASTGSTHAELSSVLGFDNDRQTVRRKFGYILNTLKTQSSLNVLDLASRIYVAENIATSQHFSAIAETFYKTEIKNINFDHPVKAAFDINQWINITTHGRIPGLVNADDVYKASAFILNTIFFEGTWLHQFAPNVTKPDFFYLSATSKKETPFMNIRDKFYFAESSKFNAKILRMPYLGNAFAMYIVVPNTLTGIVNVFNDLSDLRSELYYLQEYTVDVTLPKFKFEYTSQLDGILKEMGIRQVFEDTASLPGISRGQNLNQRLKVSRVIQRSGIQVNELGSIAYSATEVALENKFGGASEYKAEVVANKPFLFFIQDETTKQLLFTGRVSDPALVDGVLKLPFLLTVGIQNLHCSSVPPEISRLNFFDTDLLRYLAENKKGNVLVSPASVKSTLSMILEGASGATEEEIRSALRLAPYKFEFREQLNIYLKALNVNTTGVVLQNANAIFVSKAQKIKKDYEQILRQVYYADIKTVDFSYSNNVSDTINQWVNKQTKGLIPNIVQPSDINPQSESVIANALYFRGSWKRGFNPRHTRPACFHVEKGCLKVAMMELHHDLNYAFVENLRAHALELPYEGNRYSMFLLVPQEKAGLNTLLRDLPYMSLPQITPFMENTNVRLFMPKFSIDYSDSMVGALRSMRITSLFSKNASLPGMFENQNTEVNDIMHKVHMSVDEVGTVAAAVSVAVVIPLIEDGIQLQVDRPFVFFIRDNELEITLFEGKIEEPSVYVETAEPISQTAKEYRPQFASFGSPYPRIKQF